MMQEAIWQIHIQSSCRLMLWFMEQADLQNQPNRGM